MIAPRETEQQHYPERTGIRPRLERYCRQFREPKGSQRSCPAGSMAEVGLRWCGTTPLSTERRISMSTSAKKPSPRPAHTEKTAAKPLPLAMPDHPRPKKGDPGSSRHRDAAFTRGCNDRRDDESHGLAAAFGARLPCRRGAQASQAVARVKEGGRRPGLPDRGWPGSLLKRRWLSDIVRLPHVLG